MQILPPSFLLPATSESVESKGSYPVEWDDCSWPYTGNKVVSTEQREGGRTKNNLGNSLGFSMYCHVQRKILIKFNSNSI